MTLKTRLVKLETRTPAIDKSFVWIDKGDGDTLERALERRFCGDIPPDLVVFVLPCNGRD